MPAWLSRQGWTRTWPLLHGHGAAPPRPARGRLCPPGLGTEGVPGVPGCCGTSSPEPFHVLSAVLRAGAVSVWLIPGAGMLWEVLPTPRGSELP